jgi:hypothetical protein
VRNAIATTSLITAFTFTPAVVAVDSQFANVGQQEPPPDGGTPFVRLADGVQIKDFRLGSGEQAVQRGSRVELTVKGRLLNLNGVSASAFCIPD